ncbi:SDR family oxidoreductase [Pseudomonas sp. CGJS7]|uniref:SDR family oxidoreductase n=1 Tax=Pseudomonas sp. CGJS7 TaxID=3109348 RepID=UPI00300A4947
MNAATTTVLVTGGSGFVAGHCIVQLLNAGYRVRTSVRDLRREAGVRATLARAGVDAGERLSFYAADLLGDAGWAEAVAGCDYVLHVASPFPAGVPKHADELIVPAREGSLRVLRAARDAGVKRVVLTSSFAAIGYGHPGRTEPFDETVWSQLSERVGAYSQSKTLAERAAWDFIEREGGGMQLATVNPTGVFGPVLGPELSTSIGLIQRMLAGGLPGCPALYFGTVDVRDVADLHLRAMTDPAANGERFLAVAGDFMSVFEIAQALRRGLGTAAAKAPKRQLPDWMVRIVGWFDPAVRQIVPDLGQRKNASNAKAKRLLGWAPRSNDEGLIAAARSLIELERGEI